MLAVVLGFVVMSFATLIPWTTASSSLHVPTQTHVCHYTSSKLIVALSLPFLSYIFQMKVVTYYDINNYVFLCMFLCDPVFHFCIEQ